MQWVKKLFPRQEESREPLSIEAGALCDTGMVREINQDRVWAVVGENAPVDVDGVFVVADGMGGHAAGEVAAQMAVDGVRDRILALSGASILSSPDTMRTLMDGVNEDVFIASYEPGRQGMGATLTIGVIAGSTLVTGHVGDSRAYLLRDGVLAQLTPDHSWVMEMVAAGALTMEQAANHPRRNVLTRALGIGRNVEVYLGMEDVFEGDVLLLCSDGLHGVVSELDIVRSLSGSGTRAQAACEELVRLANQGGGPDNIGVVVACLNRLSDSVAPVAMSDEANSIDGTAVTLPPGPGGY